ncbi:hypothetical protein HIM_03981 [Hirsutella minnesotensis 3608]|uniref:DNA polymerase epsilon subunit D n=1 Tax=Hirsutella minnesotensis 3608 TaxID=1043627 RepID=A0A0F7ZQ52_9HYPO|nr:hypothetical protein HIM_03981 [Hirsutella minnesotensis 3608]
MPSRKSDARKSDASVVVATTSPKPPEESVTVSPDDSLPTAGNGQANTAAVPADKKDRDSKEKDAVTIEDLTLPKSIITRLAKGVLPPNTQIQANAILAMSKGATVFISYLASHANEHTTNAGKKTISPADVFKALDDTEFSFLRGPLEAEFAKFNAVQTEKRSSYRQKARAAKEGPSSRGDDTDMADTTTTSEAASGPRAKRARTEPNDHADTEDEDAEVDDDDEAAAAAAADGDDDDEVVEEEDEEEDDDEGEEGGSGDETQDALEDRTRGEEQDEALDGDESD